jgi:hypothetical protein
MGGPKHPKVGSLNTQKSEVKTPYCKVVVDERRLEHTVQDQIEISK